jgi:thiamine biosynthesis lipoprotein
VPRLLPRRSVLRFLAAASASGLTWKLGRSGGTRPVTAARPLLGTWVHLTIEGDDREAARAAAEATLDEMAGLEALLSRHRADSEVSRLNATGRIKGATRALRDVLRLADGIYRMGEGAFDITVAPLFDCYREYSERGQGLPPLARVEEARARVDQRHLRVEGQTVYCTRPGLQITLDGIAKGYIVDRGVAVLKERGFPHLLVEAGGDLVASGSKDPQTAWRIGIRNPRRSLGFRASFEARDQAVATSGDYMQPFAPDYSQHHIVDPRTGYSPPELASSTVVAPDAATADALATLVMVLGPRVGVELLEELPGCEGYLVAKTLEVTRTSGFALL